MSLWKESIRKKIETNKNILKLFLLWCGCYRGCKVWNYWWYIIGISGGRARVIRWLVTTWAEAKARAEWLCTSRGMDGIVRSHVIDDEIRLRQELLQVEFLFDEPYALVYKGSDLEELDLWCLTAVARIDRHRWGLIWSFNTLVGVVDEYFGCVGIRALFEKCVGIDAILFTVLVDFINALKFSMRKSCANIHPFIELWELFEEANSIANILHLAWIAMCRILNLTLLGLSCPLGR